MNVPARKPLTLDPLVIITEEVRADPVEVFRLRCHSRARLWHSGEIDLHSAVDELQHAAEASGLIGAIGQDAVQGLMVEAFAPLRDDLPSDANASLGSGTAKDSNGGDDANASPDGSTFAEACRKADEKQRRKSPDPRLERLRRFMDDDVSLERAWHELNARAPGDVPIATLRTAEHLLQQGDADRWRKWFDARSPAERVAILQHLERRKGRRGK
jgi:hypothetical protein